MARFVRYAAGAVLLVQVGIFMAIMPFFLIGAGIAAMLGILPEWVWHPIVPSAARFILGWGLVDIGLLVMALFLWMVDE